MDSGIFIKYTYIEKSLLFIDKLLEYGWSVNDGGKITFLPVNDIDFDWQRKTLSDWSLIYSLLNKKVNANEKVGLVLTFAASQAGCNFIFDFYKNSISISPSINRKTISDTKTTDFSWYLDRLKPILTKYVEEIECKDIYL